MPRHGARDRVMALRVPMVRLPDLGRLARRCAGRGSGELSAGSDASGARDAAALRGRGDGRPVLSACQQGIPCWEFFGDFLYMRPRSANVAYGVVFNGPVNTPPAAATPIQVAQPGTASIDFHPGWRVGFAKSLDECNAVVATFSHYEGEDQDSISTNQFEIRSMVSQPSTWTSNAASDWVAAASDYQMIYSLADVDFRWTFENQNDTRLSLLAGMRYASLDQRLDSTFTSTDVQVVHSQVNFEGGGLRIGFDGERRTPFGLVFYGRAAASLVAGTFRCDYTQVSAINGYQVETGYPADRVVPMLDARNGHRIVAVERQAAAHGRLFLQRLVQRRPHRSVHRRGAGQQLHRHEQRIDVRRFRGPRRVGVLVRLVNAFALDRVS